MLRYLLAACWTALFVLSHGDTSGAKPPDLPDNQPVTVAAPAETRATPAKGCPYPECAASDRRVLTDSEVAVLPSVLDNLRALEKAAKAVEKAKKLGHAGKMTEAIECLEQAARRCPGTSWAVRAEEVLQDLTSAQAVNIEEQAPSDKSDCCCCKTLAKINNCCHCWMAWASETWDAWQAEPTPPARVGQLFVVGGGYTLQKVIQNQLPLCPGQVLTPTALKVTEHYLQVVANSCPGAGCSIITVVEISADPTCVYKDVLITVQEVSTGSIIVGQGVNSDSGLTGSVVVNERNFDTQKPAVPAEKICAPCQESACPKCEQMHQQVLLKRKKRLAGVEEQVNGLMKACYLAVSEGRHAKAVDLARQAHALDAKRVEADPMVYKLHLLPEKGQMEECEEPCHFDPICPCGEPKVDSELSMRPELPPVDPALVGALDRLLTTPSAPPAVSRPRAVPLRVTVGEDGYERVGVDFEAEAIAAPKEEAEGEGEDEEVGCHRFMIHLDLFGLLPTVSEEDSLQLSLSPCGSVSLCGTTTVAGMRVLAGVHHGLPLLWVQTEPAEVIHKMPAVERD